jgi:Tfp pilus assembly protein PilX
MRGYDKPEHVTSRHRSLKRSRGQSFVEVLAASTVLATCLVPALRMMRDGIRISRQTETSHLLVLLATSTLEERIVRVAAKWERGTWNGDFRNDGYPEIRFTVSASDQSSDGGMPGALMALTTTVWHDRNGNAVPDAGETKVTLATKVGKSESYQNVAR